MTKAKKKGKPIYSETLGLVRLIQRKRDERYRLQYRDPKDAETLAGSALH